MVVPALHFVDLFRQLSVSSISPSLNLAPPWAIKAILPSATILPQPELPEFVCANTVARRGRVVRGAALGLVRSLDEWILLESDGGLTGSLERLGCTRSVVKVLKLDVKLVDGSSQAKTPNS